MRATREPAVPLRELLVPRTDYTPIRDPGAERYVTVRLHGKGAVPRQIGDGKTPTLRAGLRLRDGDLVYSRIDARNGAFALVPSGLGGAVVSKDFPSFGVRASRVLPCYLLLYLTSPGFYGLLRASSLGATNRQRITEESLLSYGIPLPPLAEQERIVRILDEADALRRLRREADRRTADLVPAIFHEMFGDPATNPKGWAVAAAGSLMMACEYGTSRKANDDGRGVPIIGMQHLTVTGNVETDKVRHVDLPANELAHQRLAPGDVLFNRTNSRELVGKTAMWDGRFEAVAASYLIRVRFDSEREDPLHFVTFMNLPLTKARLASMARGAIGQANINGQELRGVAVPVPPLPLQRTFAARVAEVRAMEAKQADSRRRLNDLFDSLLHRAFAGEL